MLKKLASSVPIIVLLSVSWAIWYVNDTLSKEDGAASILLIRPMVLLLIIGGIWVVAETIFKQLDDSAKTGLIESRRLSLIIMAGIFSFAISGIGFIASSSAFTISLGFVLGVRGWQLLFLPVFTMVIIWGFFATLLGLSLPLWPSF